MDTNPSSTVSRDETLAAWTRIGIASGLVACVVYPVMILVSLPRVPQLVLGASFGPALAAASVAIVPLLGANFYYFPDPPCIHGFPHVGIFTGLWYLAVVVMFIRAFHKGRIADHD